MEGQGHRHGEPDMEIAFAGCAFRAHFVLAEKQLCCQTTRTQVDVMETSSEETPVGWNLAYFRLILPDLSHIGCQIFRAAWTPPARRVFRDILSRAGTNSVSTVPFYKDPERRPPVRRGPCVPESADCPHGAQGEHESKRAGPEDGAPSWPRFGFLRDGLISRTLRFINRSRPQISRRLRQGFRGVRLINGRLPQPLRRLGIMNQSRPQMIRSWEQVCSGCPIIT